MRRSWDPITVNGVIWLGVASGSAIAAAMGLIPWDGFAPWPIWMKVGLGLVLGSLTTAVAYVVRDAA